MLPYFYHIEKKLSLKRELALFKDINTLQDSLGIEEDTQIVDFKEFKEQFIETKMNLIHFSLSKAECPIEFSNLV